MKIPFFHALLGAHGGVHGEGTRDGNDDMEDRGWRDGREKNGEEIKFCER